MSPNKFYNNVKIVPITPLSSLCPQQMTQTWKDLCNPVGLTLLGGNTGVRECYWETLTVNLAFHQSDLCGTRVYVWTCVYVFISQTMKRYFIFFPDRSASFSFSTTYLTFSSYNSKKNSINLLSMISSSSMTHWIPNYAFLCFIINNCEIFSFIKKCLLRA